MKNKLKKYNEHDIVYAKFELDTTIPSGASGTIVHVYGEYAYVVEFFVDSKSIIKTVMHDQICDNYHKFEV